MRGISVTDSGLDVESCLSHMRQAAVNTVLHEASLKSCETRGEYYGTFFLLWAICELPHTHLHINDFEKRIANLLSPTVGKCHREFLEFAALMSPTKFPQNLFQEMAKKPYARGRALNWLVLRLVVEALKGGTMPRLRMGVVAWLTRSLIWWRRVEYGLLRDLPGGPSTQYTAFTYALMCMFALKFNHKGMRKSFIRHYGVMRFAVLQDDFFSRVGRGANQMKAYVALFVCELFYSEVNKQPPSWQILNMVVHATVNIANVKNSVFRVTANNTNAALNEGTATGNHWSYNSDRDYAALCAALTLYGLKRHDATSGK